ncbi:MAG: 50S ribosomal protein L15 [Candidatus Latescibacterota bacterium]|nr:MAG: 50S ribosomal protein L15 [Candidatus Latescibacterota bacterium]
MRIGELKAAEGSRKKKKRIACGTGSGYGKTAGKGHKGQRSRSGSRIPAWFEGGQMPLQRRLPKRGFHNQFRTIFQIVNVKDLNRFPADAGVDVNSLYEAGLIRKKRVPVKLLGAGEIDRPLKVSVHACTRKAKELVEKAGGEIRIIGS